MADLRELLHDAVATEPSFTLEDVRRRARRVRLRRAGIGAALVCSVAVLLVPTVGLVTDRRVQLVPGTDTASPPTAAAHPDAEVIADQPTLPDDEAYEYIGVATDADAFDEQWARFHMEGAAPAVDFGSRVAFFVGFGESGSCPYEFGGVAVEADRVTLLDAAPADFICTDDYNSRTIVVAIDRSALPAGAFTVDMPADAADVIAAADETAVPPPATPNVISARVTDVDIQVEPERAQLDDVISVAIVNRTEGEMVAASRSVTVERWTGHYWEPRRVAVAGEGVVTVAPGESAPLVAAHATAPAFADGAGWYRLTAGVDVTTGSRGRIEPRVNLEIIAPADEAAGIPHPTTPGEIVLSVETGGGLGDDPFTASPSAVVYGDGLALRQSEDGTYAQAHLDEMEIQALLQRASEIGLVDGSADPGPSVEGVDVSDAATTVWTLNTADRVVITRVYPADDSFTGMFTPEDLAVRQTLREFEQQLGLAISEGSPWTPQHVDVRAMPWPTRPPVAVEPWPFPHDRGVEMLDGICVTVGVRHPFATGAEWVDLNELSQVTRRPVLPHAVPCEPLTTQERDVVDRLIAFARDPGAETFAELHFADQVHLGLGPQLQAPARSAAELADPARWSLNTTPDGSFRARVGPFSALELLGTSTDVTVDLGPMPHCAAPPMPVPEELANLRHVAIQPAQSESCIQWWIVDVFLADDAIAGVSLDLWEP